MAFHSSSDCRKGRLTSYVAAAAVAASVLVAPNMAKAEVVSSTGKGAVGGGLLGAEVVMLSLGIAGVDKWWAYLLGGVGGAAGGAVGGYFVETEVTASEPSLYMLAGGMALVIPTVVVMLNATAYNPEADVVDGEIESDDPAAPAGAGPEPSGANKRAKKRVAKKTRPHLPMALLGVDMRRMLHGGPMKLSAGIPNVAIKPMYSRQEQTRYGVSGGTDVHIPLVSGVF